MARGFNKGMPKMAVRLLQFMAIFMITGGGVAVAGDIVAGAHNIVGWIVVVLGVLLLLFGARKPMEY